MTGRKLTYQVIAAALWIAGGVLLSVFPAFGADYRNCVPSSSNGKYTTECPDGRTARNDIDVQCMRNQTDEDVACLNTMPVAGTVARIPEDVCYRGTGWSNKRNHNGIDYAAAAGTPVVAAADGIAYVNACVNGGGRTVRIVHQKANDSSNEYSLIQDSSNSSYTSIYMHLASIDVANGTFVKKGQKIGTVGGSSCSNGIIDEDAYGTHLHFEMRDGAAGIGTGTVLDPMCNDIQDLCSKQSYSSFYQGDWSSLTGNGGKSSYNAMACRDCEANKEACKKQPGDEDDPKENSPASSGGSSSTAAKTGPCVTLYPEDDLLLFAAQGESGNNAGKTNWYSKYSNVEGSGCFGNVPGTYDTGGCSYGFVQMTCGTTQGTSNGISNGTGKNAGSFRTFMKRLAEEKPELYAQLDQGGFEQTMIYACSDQAFPKQNAKFRAAWKALGSNQDFYDLQYQVAAEQYASTLPGILQRKGLKLDWNNLSPEVQMSFVKANLAGAIPYVSKQLNSKYAGQNLNDIPTEDLITDICTFLAGAYSNNLDDGSSATYNAVQARAQKDIDKAVKSAQLREAIEANPGKDPDLIAQELFGMRICDEDEIGKNYANKQPVVSSSATAAADQIAAAYGGRDCSVSKYRNSFKDCIFCSIFEIVFNTASLLAAKAYSVLAQGVENLVIVGMALWLAMLVLKYVSGFETKDPRNLVKEIFNQAFVVIVVIILLRAGATEFMNLVLTPVFETGMQLAQLAVAGDGGETCNASVMGGVNQISGGLPVSMGQSIVCTVDAIQNKILDIMAVGSSALCAGFYIYSWHQIVLFPHLGFVLTGLLLWISALLILIIYPWLLIDSVLQMCIAAILLPVAIGAYAFKSVRRRFVPKVWGTFMEAMFMFVFLSMVVSVLILSLDSVTAEAFDRKLMEAGTSDNLRTLLDGVGWWSLNCLKLIFVMLLGWAVLGEAKAFAASFAQGGFSVGGIGSQVGTLAMSGVKGAGLAGLGLGQAAVTKGGGALAETVKEKANDFKQSRQKHTMERRMRQLSSQGTTGSDGSVSYTNGFGRKFTMNADGRGYSYRDWLGRTVTKSISTDDQGRQVVTVSTRNTLTGRTTEVSNDGYIRSQVIKDKNGTVISHRTEMTTAAGKYLINKDGTINQIALNNIMQNSAHSAEVVNMAILQQLIQERMPGLHLPEYQEFKSQHLSFTTDENGRQVFTLSRTFNNGTVINMSMMSGADSRILTSVEQIDVNNNASLHASDGIVNKQSNYQYRNGKIDKQSVLNRFSFTSYYNKLYRNPMDSLGNLSGGLTRENILFNDDDFEELKKQIARDGTPENLDVFK